MKKTILFTIILLQGIFSIAQTNVYQPFPKDSAAWFTIRQDPYGAYYSTTIWLGDTTINGFTYTKHVDGNGKYLSGIRQDIPNEKIYNLDINGVEKDISVNQHLLVGDIFEILPWSIHDTLFVSTIDSLKIGSKYHKRYNFISVQLK